MKGKLVFKGGREDKEDGDIEEEREIRKNEKKKIMKGMGEREQMRREREIGI